MEAQGHAVTHDTWPHLMRVLADLVGAERTLQIVQRWGGLSNVRIPAQADVPHPWTEVLGPEAWTRVVAHLGGQRVDVPRGCHLSLLKVAVMDLIEREPQMGDGDIALRVGCTQRYVRGLRGGRRRRAEDPRQVRLFDD